MPNQYTGKDNPKQRFFEKVNKTSDNECWKWTGATFKNGYGGIYFKGKVVGAHRLSWIFHFGQIPDGMLICHTCDNRLCVNPDHLFLGTYKDNNVDKSKKGRSNAPRGEKSGWSRITQKKAHQIKTLLKTKKYTITKIAEMTNETYQLVHSIATERSWKWLHV